LAEGKIFFPFVNTDFALGQTSSSLGQTNFTCGQIVALLRANRIFLKYLWLW